MSTAPLITLRICLDDAAAPVLYPRERSIGRCDVYVGAYDVNQGQPTWLLSHESDAHGMAMSAYYGGNFAEQTWAWEYGMTCSDRLVTPRKASAMAKRLAAIERKYEKLCAMMGQPQTFGQYVIYLAQCLKIQHFCWQTAGRDGGQCWRTTTIPEDARSYIDRHIAEWHEAHPLPERAVA